MTKSKPATQAYHILDKGMRFVGANRIRPGQKTVLATEAEAKFFLENGGLSLTDPAETKAAHKAEAEKDAAAAKEAREAAKAPEAAPIVSDDLAAVVEQPEAPAAEEPAKGAASHKRAR